VQLIGRVDHLDDLDALAGNTASYSMARSSLESRQSAWAISDVIGAWAPIIDRYLDALSFAPSSHLALLAKRGARIVFAPTIADALTSETVGSAARRGARLVRDLEGPDRVRTDAGVAGVYDRTPTG
jgi:hypothetical protein